MSKDKSEPAFPIAAGFLSSADADGMTKREVYALHAMQGLIAVQPEGLNPICKEDIAESAFRMADAMLEEGAK